MEEDIGEKVGDKRVVSEEKLEALKPEGGDNEDTEKQQAPRMKVEPDERATEEFPVVKLDTPKSGGK